MNPAKAIAFSPGEEEPLARYHFQVRTRSHVLADEGLDLVSQDEARAEAARRVGDLLKEHAGLLWLEQDWHMDVTDETGLILFIIQVSALNAPSTSKGRAAKP